MAQFGLCLLPISRVMMFKRRHFDCTVILLCVRWYLAYSLSQMGVELSGFDTGMPHQFL